MNPQPEIFDKDAFRRLCSRERLENGFGFDVFWDMGMLLTGFRNPEEQRSVSVLSPKSMKRMKKMFRALNNKKSRQ